MADLLFIDIAKISKRPAGKDTYLVVNEQPMVMDTLRIIPRRPKPSVPQFSGTVSPPREVKVSLQRSRQRATETVISDPSGYFEFTGWYYPHSDYEFFVHGDDLYEAVVFALDTPVEHRWNGNPVLYDSTNLI